jgi:hypothetical protein
VKKKLRCRYSIEVESNTTKLVFDCRGCQGSGDLDDARCFGEAIAALRSEFNVDSIIFSNYIETNYYGLAIDALKRISGIMNEVQRFSGRIPWKEMGETKDIKLQSRKKMCLQCDKNPAKIFSVIEKRGKRSIESMCKSFNHYLSVIESLPADRQCHKCNQNTRADLNYIQDKIEDLKMHVLYHAFKVVEVDG